METSFKLTTIIECSQVTNKSKNIFKVPSPSDFNLLNFINPLVLTIVENKFDKKIEQDSNP